MAAKRKGAFSPHNMPKGPHKTAKRRAAKKALLDKKKATKKGRN